MTSSQPSPSETATSISTPHPPLTAYYRSEAERATFVRDLFDRAAPGL